MQRPGQTVPIEGSNPDHAGTHPRVNEVPSSAEPSSFVPRLRIMAAPRLGEQRRGLLTSRNQMIAEPRRIGRPNLAVRSGPC